MKKNRIRFVFLVLLITFIFPSFQAAAYKEKYNELAVDFQVDEVEDHYMVLGLKETKKLSMSGKSIPLSHSSVKWKSSNQSIAVISNIGSVKGVKKGITKITGTVLGDSNQTYTFTLEVVPSNTKIYKNGFYFHTITSDIKKRINGKSYTENKNISYQDLRYIRVKHYGYDGKVKKGELITNKAIAQDIVEIFYKLYNKKYPIQKMVLIDEYNGDDIVSMSDNNTSAFNYRKISGSSNLSKHGYGLAIDINPRMNPYVKGKKFSPANGVLYIQRERSKCKGKYKDQMIQKGDLIYNLFLEHGFSWGGNWKSSKDYQHFEKVQK